MARYTAHACDGDAFSGTCSTEGDDACRGMHVAEAVHAAVVAYNNDVVSTWQLGIGSSGVGKRQASGLVSGQGRTAAQACCAERGGTNVV